MKINVGDEITINGKVVECDVRCSMVCCRMNDGNIRSWLFLHTG
jgi:predicted acyltransferase (DUF342 family)